MEKTAGKAGFVREEFLPLILLLLYHSHATHWELCNNQILASSFFNPPHMPQELRLGCLDWRKANAESVSNAFILFL